MYDIHVLHECFTLQEIANVNTNILYVKAVRGTTQSTTHTCELRGDEEGERRDPQPFRHSFHHNKSRAQMLEEISAYNTDLSVLMTVTRYSSTYTSLINNITGQ